MSDAEAETTMHRHPTRFGSMLRLYRTVRQQTLRDLAVETGISHATLMRIEHGEAFDVATLLKLARWLLDPEVAHGAR